MSEFTLPAPAENALSKLQDTPLTPMEEALFQAWTKANQIEKPDDPNSHVDFRGIFQGTSGTILPNGELKRITDQINYRTKLEKVLQDRMMQHVDKVKQKHMGPIEAANGPAESSGASSPKS